MKKIFLAISMVALFAAGALAQGISGGLKGGLNLANLNGDDVSNTDMKIAYHIGGYVNVAFSEALSVQPELLFNSVGAKASEDGYDGKYNINYISVPVMLIYSFGNFNIQAGPQVGFLMSAKLKVEGGGDSQEIDYKDYLKSTDFGFNLGLGANFGKLNAAARYCIGLSNIADDDNADVKNGVIQLSLGVKLFGD
ncbi:MAG TPA: porin family protein [Cyclobacteriaceae bacterium]|nr:porin family protein [Cyclobacteriaceae bacterium]